MQHPLISRRDFLGRSLLAGGAAFAASRFLPTDRWQSQTNLSPPAFTVIPVVGDGKWIWNQPPTDQAGFLEPRWYSLKVGIEIESRGSLSGVLATTPVPVDCPEQKLNEEQVKTSGCEAQVRELAPYSRQLVLAAEDLAPGQTISATATYNLTGYKQYLKYERDRFPAAQKIPADVRQLYLGDSTGIQTRAPQVRALLKKLVPETLHPWDQARRFADWVRANIKPQLGPYTSVLAAIENLRGDCEEMSAVFVALCRAAGIPARLVWVPNHNWSEFYLVDEHDQGHWIPVHTACYHWFGWTGVHELVLQKGDRITTPEKPTSYRLVKDWMQWQGRKPQVRYWAELEPLPPPDGKDAGPGARRKIETGEWQLIAKHTADRYMRK
jgi:transglutaminase-like putative cysteine protease